MSQRNSLIELKFLLKAGLYRLMSKLFFVSRIYLLCPCAKIVNSSKDGILFVIFSNIKSDVPTFSKDLTFQCLSVLT